MAGKTQKIRKMILESENLRWARQRNRSLEMNLLKYFHLYDRSSQKTDQLYRQLAKREITRRGWEMDPALEVYEKIREDANSRAAIDKWDHDHIWNIKKKFLNDVLVQRQKRIAYDKKGALERRSPRDSETASPSSSVSSCKAQIFVRTAKKDGQESRISRSRVKAERERQDQIDVEVDIQRCALPIFYARTEAAEEGESEDKCLLPVRQWRVPKHVQDLKDCIKEVDHNLLVDGNMHVISDEIRKIETRREREKEEKRKMIGVGKFGSADKGSLGIGKANLYTASNAQPVDSLAHKVQEIELMAMTPSKPVSYTSGLDSPSRTFLTRKWTEESVQDLGVPRIRDRDFDDRVLEVTERREELKHNYVAKLKKKNKAIDRKQKEIAKQHERQEWERKRQLSMKLHQQRDGDDESFMEKIPEYLMSLGALLGNTFAKPKDASTDGTHSSTHKVGMSDDAACKHEDILRDICKVIDGSAATADKRKAHSSADKTKQQTQDKRKSHQPTSPGTGKVKIKFQSIAKAALQKQQQGHAHPRGEDAKDSPIPIDMYTLKKWQALLSDIQKIREVDRLIQNYSSRHMTTSDARSIMESQTTLTSVLHDDLEEFIEHDLQRQQAHLVEIYRLAKDNKAYKAELDNLLKSLKAAERLRDDLIAHDPTHKHKRYTKLDPVDTLNNRLLRLTPEQINYLEDMATALGADVRFHAHTTEDRVLQLIKAGSAAGENLLDSRTFSHTDTFRALSGSPRPRATAYSMLNKSSKDEGDLIARMEQFYKRFQKVKVTETANMEQLTVLNKKEPDKDQGSLADFPF